MKHVYCHDEPLEGVLAMSEADVNERMVAMVPDIVDLLIDKIEALRRTVQEAKEAKGNAQGSGKVQVYQSPKSW